MNNKAQIKFIFMSLLGFVFFIVPIPINGENKIIMSHFVSLITNNAIKPFLILTQILSLITIVCTIVSLFYHNKFLDKFFKTSPVGALLRISGSFLYISVLQGWFTEVPILKALVDGNTGGVLAGVEGLLTILYLTFFIGLLALPLLTHFGAVEFLGVLCSPFMKKVFRVPGFSAVDAVASFVGDGTIGIVVTDKQYQRGYYTKKEAFIIATNFSIVGIAFATSVATKLGLDQIFFLFYGSIALVTVIIAIISSRLPYKKYTDEYYNGVTPVTQEVNDNESIYSQALKIASEQAEKADFSEISKESFTNILNIYIGFLPVIMLIGSFSLAIAETTNIFITLSAFLIPLYEMFGFTTEVASAMAPASIVGITDMYLPALFVLDLPSEAARFFIGVLSFSQLIYFSETGIILMKSKLDINIFKVISLFIYRTVLSIPIIFLITKVLVMLNIISM